MAKNGHRSARGVLWQLILVAAMLCRYERKAIVSSAKDKTKAKPKVRPASSAKGARAASHASKTPRDGTPSTKPRPAPARGSRGAVHDGEGAGEPVSARKGAPARTPRGQSSTSRASKGEAEPETAVETETPAETASGGEAPEPEEADDEIIEAAAEVVDEEVKVDDIPKPS